MEANEQLGFEADLRGYEAPAAVVRYFGLRAVRLMSNNPEKIQALEKAGVRVAERVPSIVEPVESTADYLRTKREKMGHLLDGRVNGPTSAAAARLRSLADSVVRFKPSIPAATVLLPRAFRSASSIICALDPADGLLEIQAGVGDGDRLQRAAGQRGRR